MSPENSKRYESGRTSVVRLLLPLLCSVVLIAISISGQSLWIDEASTAVYAMKPSLELFFDTLLNDKASEAQMPAGMLLAYFFEKALGHSEYALRAPNFFWLSLGVLALWRVGCHFGAAWLPLLLAAHPMVWYYADEARPYALQVGMACVLVWVADALIRHRRISMSVFWTGWIAALLLCASSLMTSILFAVLLLVLVVMGWRSRWVLTRVQWGISGGMLLVLGMLAVYYAWTVSRGAGGAMIWNVGFTNLAFTFFEFGGFMGFSPGRIVFRETARQGLGGIVTALQPYVLPLVCLGGLYTTVIVLAVMNYSRLHAQKIFVICLAVLGLGISSVFLLCMWIGFPFWGRHLISLLPFMLVVLALALTCGRGRLRRLLPAGLILILLTASLLQRFTYRHAKDDYRQAVMMAKKIESEGRVLLWVASVSTANYYGYDPYFHCQNVKERVHPGQFDAIIFSRVDIFDPHGKSSGLLSDPMMKMTHRFPAFTVWERSGTGDQDPVDIKELNNMNQE